MTQLTGRTDNGPARRRLRTPGVLVLVATLAACATPPAGQSGGTSTAPLSVVSVPPPGPATARCAQETEETVQIPAPPQPPAEEAAQQRAAEVLRQMNGSAAPPERGALPAEARTGATACAREIHRTLSLYAGGERRLPDVARMREFLRSAGLERVTVSARGRYAADTPEGLVFSGWTGQACVYGGFVAGRPDIRIGPPLSDGACLPPA